MREFCIHYYMVNYTRYVSANCKRKLLDHVKIQNRLYMVIWQAIMSVRPIKQPAWCLHAKHRNAYLISCTNQYISSPFMTSLPFICYKNETCISNFWMEIPCMFVVSESKWKWKCKAYDACTWWAYSSMTNLTMLIYIWTNSIDVTRKQHGTRTYPNFDRNHRCRLNMVIVQFNL